MRKRIKSILFSLVFILLAVNTSYTCTNFLVTQGATQNGSTMITYAADSHVLFGELYFSPAQDHPEDAKVEIYEWDTGEYLGKIDQVSHTYQVTGNMNEHQVSISETTFGGREELQEQPDAVMDYGSLIYITLQRAKSAREAIKIMGNLVEKYGYYSSGESFSIADKDEVWIMEMIGKGEYEKGAVWVARKIPDGYISGHANQARIRTFPLDKPEKCIYSDDVISFARDRGWYEGKDEDFSFTETYAPVNFTGARFCEARVWSGFRSITEGMGQYRDYAMGKDLDNPMPLWVKPDEKLNAQDVQEMMRDHFEGTKMDMRKDIGAGPYDLPYRWRPLVWENVKENESGENDTVQYFNERAISTQQTGFSFVAQMRSWLPDPIGGILWFGVDDSYSSVYVPIYCGVNEVPAAFAAEEHHHTWYSQKNGAMMEFDYDHAFWVFNMVSNWAYTRYRDMIPIIREKQKALESKFKNYTPAIDQAAWELYKDDKELGREFLTDYSISQTNKTMKTWKQLSKHLFTRFMDGNVKSRNPDKRNPNLKQPGYGEEWYEEIIEETGDKFKMR